MKPLTLKQKEKIKNYIKNKIDISDLIKGYDIKGMDLSRAIISKFDRPGDNMSGTIFANAIIGTTGEITNLSRCNFVNCSFQNARFLGNIWMRYCDVRNANMQGTHIPHLDFRFADFRGVNFCNGCFPIGSIANKRGIGAKFSDNLFMDIAFGWELPILSPEQVKELMKIETVKPIIEKMLADNKQAAQEV